MGVSAYAMREGFHGAIDAFSRHDNEAGFTSFILGTNTEEAVLSIGGADFLDGARGVEYARACAEADVLVYDPDDYLIRGGSGIGFLISEDTSLTMDDLLDEREGPLVEGFEVLITGAGVSSLTNSQELAARLGITLGTDAAGNTTMALSGDWSQGSDGTWSFAASEDFGLLTLYTDNLQEVSNVDQTIFVQTQAQG